MRTASAARPGCGVVSQTSAEYTPIPGELKARQAVRPIAGASSVNTVTPSARTPNSSAPKIVVEMRIHSATIGGWSR